MADIKEMFEGLRLSERGLVLMPINDNSNPEAAGGSHWYETRHCTNVRVSE